MGAISNWIKNATKNEFVYSIRIGSTPGEDTFNGFFRAAKKQIEESCSQLSAIKELNQGF
jgi:hypothetical protein